MQKAAHKNVRRLLKKVYRSSPISGKILFLLIQDGIIVMQTRCTAVRI